LSTNGGSPIPIPPKRFVKLSGSRGSLVVRLTRPLVKARGFGSFHADLIMGKDYGETVVLKDREYTIRHPSIPEILEEMPRKAQVITLKDGAHIIGRCDIGPGSRVVEAGSGSGAMTLMLARAVGESGKVVSLDVREEHRKFARSILDSAGLGHRVEFLHGDMRDLEPSDFSLDDPDDGGMAEHDGNLAEHDGGLVEHDGGLVEHDGGLVEHDGGLVEHDGGLVEHDDMGNRFDAAVLDLPDPWQASSSVKRALRPGGMVAVYVPTIGQLERTRGAFHDAGFLHPEALEILLRPWQLKEGAIRPATNMLGHTAFLFFAERPVRE